MTFPFENSRVLILSLSGAAASASNRWLLWRCVEIIHCYLMVVLEADVLVRHHHDALCTKLLLLDSLLFRHLLSAGRIN